MNRLNEIDKELKNLMTKSCACRKDSMLCYFHLMELIKTEDALFGERKRALLELKK